MVLAVLRTLTLLGGMLDFPDILGNYGMWGMEWGICIALPQYDGPFW
jgi:hypothetical protein